MCRSLSSNSLLSSSPPLPWFYFHVLPSLHPQVTAGTGSRLHMVPAPGSCGSSCSTPRRWGRGSSFSRPSVCTAALSPRSCFRRSTSSQVGQLGGRGARHFQGAAVERQLCGGEGKLVRTITERRRTVAGTVTHAWSPALSRLRQETHFQCKASLGYRGRPCVEM